MILQENPLAYSNLLITLEGLDDGVLDHYCQFVTSASKMMNLEVTKKYVYLISSSNFILLYGGGGGGRVVGADLAHMKIGYSQ